VLRIHHQQNPAKPNLETSVIYTNHTGLPQPLVDAVIKDPYDKGHSDLSVTQLISPPRKVALEKANDAIMEIDASDRLFALMGQIGHGILERSANSGIVEKRWYEAIDGWVVSGQCDLVLADNKLIDYKFCSVWTVKEGLKKEWEEQINLLAWLAESKAQPIREAQIICIFRDWSIMEARRDRNYPQRQVKVLPVPMWGYDRALAFCRERVKLHADAQSGTSPLPECTAEERWERPAKWAVMKKGRVRAVKRYDNEKDAIKHTVSEKNTTVQHRPGESVRCANYCAAAPFCDQWRGISGAAISPEAQAEESGGSVEIEAPGEPIGSVLQKVEAPAPQPPVQQRLDEFPVEPDVARKPSIRPGQFPVEPDAAKASPPSAPTQAPTSESASSNLTLVGYKAGYAAKAAVVPPMPAVVDFRTEPDGSDAPPMPQPTAPDRVPADPNDPAVPKPFVGRSKPVKVEETPIPPMPEVP
jgi:hypothetical protein